MKMKIDFDWFSKKSEETTENTTTQVVAEGKRWNLVQPAVRWNPTPGDVISGVFLGLRERSGEFGDYKCVIIYTGDGTYSASGVRLIDTISSSTLEPGDLIRLCYKGKSESYDGGYSYKMFDVYTSPDVIQRREIA